MLSRLTMFCTGMQCVPYRQGRMGKKINFLITRSPDHMLYTCTTLLHELGPELQALLALWWLRVLARPRGVLLLLLLARPRGVLVLVLLRWERGVVGTTSFGEAADAEGLLRPCGRWRPRTLRRKRCIVPTSFMDKERRNPLVSSSSSSRCWCCWCCWCC